VPDEVACSDPLAAFVPVRTFRKDLLISRPLNELKTKERFAIARDGNERSKAGHAWDCRKHCRRRAETDSKQLRLIKENLDHCLHLLSSDISPVTSTGCCLWSATEPLTR
jgi:hypothetical protein